jgi:hypothetical protein
MKKTFQKILIAALAVGLSAAAVKAPVAITIVRANAKIDYPMRIDFSVEARSDVEIRTVELEYGLIGRDCSPDVVIAIPDNFTPGNTVKVQWAWDIAKTGNLPPGMKIWWDWHLVDADGKETRSDKQWITWIDSIHPWSSITSENIILHWYQGTEAYAQNLIKSADNARTVLIQDVGAWPDSDINLYIYDSNQAMKDALVGAPEWIGGMTFWQNQRTIIIGIDLGNEAWGKSTIAHELAHVAVNSIMGGCYANIPLWLNEGIAVYTEGTPDPQYAKLIDHAVYYDELFSLRSISEQYQEIDGDPSLTYAESLSAVQFLVSQYGHEKIRRILLALGEGYTYDSALQSALGLDMDGLEDAWRKSIGADPLPRKIAGASSTPLTEETLPPFSSTPVYSTLIPTESAVPTRTPAAGGVGATAKALLVYPGSLISVVCIMMACLMIIGIAAGVLILSRRNSGPGNG